jgi:hypothetical protein
MTEQDKHPAEDTIQAVEILLGKAQRMLREAEKLCEGDQCRIVRDGINDLFRARTNMLDLLDNYF